SIRGRRRHTDSSPPSRRGTTWRTFTSTSRRSTRSWRSSTRVTRSRPDDGSHPPVRRGRARKIQRAAAIPRRGGGRLSDAVLVGRNQSHGADSVLCRVVEHTDDAAAGDRLRVAGASVVHHASVVPGSGRRSNGSHG